MSNFTTPGPAKSSIRSSKAALASHLGFDMAEMNDYLYQSTRFTRSVYALDDFKYCAVREVRDLPKPTHPSTIALDWEEVIDRHVNEQGYKIFKSK